MKKLLCLPLSVYAVVAFAQVDVTGKVVTGETQEPAMYAEVISVENPSESTMTDVNGSFSITLTENSGSLNVISVDGSSTVVNYEGNQNLTIELNSNEIRLNELVVTALGITKEEKKLGYATQSIDTEVIEDVSAPNIGNLFSGKVAGLQVNNPTGLFQSPSFSLRGKKPLIVIDGIPMDTDLFDISSNDIANINVLKGTSASALYGSRGKNGAILISTKKAKKKGITVEINQNIMISAGFTAYPDTQTEYGNGSNGKYEFWDGRDGGTADGDMIWGPKFSDNLEIPQWNSPIYDNVTGETIEWYGDVLGTQYDDRTRYSRVPIPWKYHDNLDDFLGTGVISQTDFAVNYKTDNGSYRLSGNYNFQQGRVPNSELERGGLSFNSSTKLSDKFTLDGKLSYNRVYSPNYPRYGYGPKNHMYTILIWMGDDVNGEDLKNHLYVPGYEGYRQANWNYAWYNNPYFAAEELNQEYDGHRVNNLMSLKYDINDNFNITARASTMIWNLFEDRESPKSYLNYGDPREGDYKTWNTSDLRSDFDVLASYNKDFTNGFELGVNIGGATFYNKHHQEYNATDGLIVPFVYSLNNTEGGYKASTYEEKKATESIYGTLDLGFDDMIFLNFTGRNDWSSTLPEDNRSYFYPSASLSLILSEMFNIKNNLEYLKLYGSWARVSSDLSPYQISSFYNTQDPFGSTPKLAYPRSIVNQDIKPEQSTSIEFGLSASMLRNRLGFDLTYFNIVDENQIINLPISEASGFSNRYVNGNEYTTNGIEFSLRATPVRNSNFKWNTLINLFHKVEKLTEIYENQERYGYLKLDDRADSYYATVWQKSADGRLILDEATGMPSKDPIPEKIGHLSPDLIIGFQNDFNYKGFSLNVGIDGQIGGVMSSRTIEKMWWGGKHPNSTEYRDQEYEAGKPVYVPNGVNLVSGELVRDASGNVISDTRVYQENKTAVSWQSWSQNYPYRAAVTEDENEKFANVLDKSFIKLRSVTLKYDINKLMKIESLSSVEASISGYNLLMWKEADIVDPDFGNDDDLQDPSTRYIGVGLNVKF